MRFVTAFIFPLTMLSGQQTQGLAPAKPASQAKKMAPAAARVAQSLTVDGVTMVQAGLSEDVIITRLRKENKAFDLSPMTWCA